MSKNLVIVESPAKAKTIEKFLGNDYHVLSSQGHIRDIQPMGKNSLGIDVEHGFAPNYVTDEGKSKLIAELKSESKKADMVWLASDEDREGEAIAWHLKEVLGLKEDKTKRIVFHEITKPAILEAIEKPRDIDYNLVDAQQARRVLDRIIGYELSPILWRKIATGLSAGRVQSVAVRLVVEKEREIESHRTSSAYRVVAEFVGRNPGDASVLKMELNHRFPRKTEAIEFLNGCMRSTFRITDVQTKPGKRCPAAPFTTSTLQQEAARKLRYPVSKTMRLAQSLYEAGHITYMRTDSVNLSNLALGTAKVEIEAEYGAEYSHVRQYHTTSKGAQEAHEAIRPSYMSHRIAGANPDEQRLYELIWKRTIASQMADAEFESTRIEVSIQDNLTDAVSPYTFVATGEVITFDGFMKAYVQSRENEDEIDESVNGYLPKMSQGEKLRLQQADAIQTFTKAPLRYNEATLVKKMEELEIGRPSTYATIIETILQHKYVERGSVPGKKHEYSQFTLKAGKVTEKTKTETYGAEQGKLLPTDLGKITTDFLVDQFPKILSYDFTAHSEESFDQIAAGQVDWKGTVESFYDTFHPLLKLVPAGKVAGRELGIDPKTGLMVTAKISKLGPCVQLGDAEGDKPRFASLKKNQSIFSITLKEALELLEKQLPYVLMSKDGHDVTIGEGKYGPYIRYRNQYISIPKGTDPFEITEAEANALIDKKKIDTLPIQDWGDIKVLNGHYGPYIKANGSNYRLPKGTNAETLTLEQVQQIIAEAGK